MHDQADIAIATEAIANYKELVSLPCFQWHHVAVMLPDHPLLERKLLSLDDLAQYPLITYDNAFAGRTKINQAFALRELTPGHRAGSDRRRRDQDLRRTGARRRHHGRHRVQSPSATAICARCRSAICSARNVTRLALKQGAYLRSYVYTLVELLSPSHEPQADRAGAFRANTKATNFERSTTRVAAGSAGENTIHHFRHGDLPHEVVEVHAPAPLLGALLRLPAAGARRT